MLTKMEKGLYYLESPKSLKYTSRSASKPTTWYKQCTESLWRERTENINGTTRKQCQATQLRPGASPKSTLGPPKKPSPVPDEDINGMCE
jgi:hypothetical protein